MRKTKAPKEIKTTKCVECRNKIRFDECSYNGSMWEFLRLDGQNVGLACAVDTDEDAYATCASCCLVKMHAKLLFKCATKVEV